MASRGNRVAWAAALFLLSGFAALTYQVIWQRILGIFSGMHLYSITMIVTAFMAGLGFGSLAGGRLADRLSRKASILAFAACELAIGLFALISPWLYYDVAYLRLGFLVRYPIALPVVHLLLLLLPTLLMGASLPLLCRGMVRDLDRAAGVVGTLYALNTLGAGLGAFVTVWYLIGRFGFAGAIGIGSLLNFAAAAGALWIAAATAPGREDAAAAASPGAPAAPAAAGLFSWAALYALSGFIALSLELSWFRILDVFIRSSPYTFGHILGVFLVSLAIGALAGVVLVRRARRPDLWFLYGQWGITVAAALSLLPLLYLAAESGPLAGLYDFWSKDKRIEMYEIAEGLRQLSGGPFPEVLTRALQLFVLLPLWLLAVPTFLMGFTYAFIQRAVQTDVRVVGWRVGVIQTANIFGAILGSLVTGVLLLHVLGTPATLRLLIVAGSLFGVLAALRGLSRRRVPLAAACVAASLLLAAMIPGRDGFWARFHGSPVDRVVVAEDASSVVTLQRMDEAQAVMRVNGTGHSQLPFWPGHVLLGCAPVLLHPDPRDVLVIGMGTGGTGLGSALSATVERIDLYEIARPEYEVLERYNNRWFVSLELRQFLTDPRIRPRFSDGRLALRVGEHRYDVIEADALEPSMAYSGNLYSKEFFELSLSRLKPGGVVLTYVPTERTRRTAIAAFPYALDFHAAGMPSLIIGSNEPFAYRPDRALERLRSRPVQQLLELAGAREALSGFLEDYFRRARVTAIDPASRARVVADEDDLNRDLFPRDEYDKRYRPTYE